MTSRQWEFWTWLKGQTRREDPIGDLARDVAQDPCLPKVAKRYQVWLTHLTVGHDAPDYVVMALREAWLECFGYDPELPRYYREVPQYERWEFSSWLKLQRDRSDVVGQLARWIEHDVCLEHANPRLDAWLEHLVGLHGLAEAAVRAAWEECYAWDLKFVEKNTGHAAEDVVR